MKKDLNIGISVAVDVLCILTIVTALIVVGGHLFEYRILTSWAPNIAGMAYPTSFCFVNISIALMVLNRMRCNGHHA